MDVEVLIEDTKECICRDMGSENNWCHYIFIVSSGGDVTQKRIQCSGRIERSSIVELLSFKSKREIQS